MWVIALPLAAATAWAWWPRATPPSGRCPKCGYDRAGLDTKVHQRVNVRILELIHKDTGSTVQLEGNRVPTLHTKDVINALHG